METGLMWCDDDKTKPLADKITEAARAHARRFDRLPDLCYVSENGSKLEIETVEVDGHSIRVETDAIIPPHHSWLGVDKEREED